MINQKYTKLYANNLTFVSITLFGVLLLISIFFIRFYVYDNKSLIGDESYLSLRISKLIIENKKIPEFDELSYGGRPFTYLLGWPHFLVFSSNITNLSLDTVSYLLPIFLGFLTLILIWLIISKYTTNKQLTILSLLILSLSPPFLYLFSVSNPFSAVLFLSTLSFYLLSFNNRICLLLSVLAASLISFFSFFATIFVLFSFFLYFLFKDRRKLKWIFLFFLIILPLEFFNYYHLIKKYGLPELININIIQNTTNFSYQALFSDFGGKFGISLLPFFLLLLGIYFLWTEKKYKYLLLYTAILLTTILSLYFSFILFYLNIFVAILGGFSLFKLIQKKWESELIKKFSLIIIFLGIFFSGFFFINQLASMDPTKKQIDALNYLESKTPADKVIFSYYNNGYWFNSIGKKNVIDGYFFYAPNLSERWDDSLKILNSNKIDQTIMLLDKYNVDYIWIDKDIKEKFYGNREVNFIYQLKYDPRFVLIYRNFNEQHEVDIEIWRYQRKKL